jgi:signal transduction histidine kinase
MQQQKPGAAVERTREVEAIFEAMTDGVAVYDVHGNVVHANAALRTLLALDRDPDYFSRPFPQRVARLAMRDAGGQPLAPEEMVQARVLRGEVLTGANAVDVVVHTLDGRELELGVSGAPIRDDAGQITGAVLVVRDVTARRGLERRAQEALAALVAMAEALVSADDVVAPATAGTDVPPATHAVGRRMAELTRSVLGCRHVSISALDPQTEVVQPVATSGFSPEMERGYWDVLPQSHLSEHLDPTHIARLRAGEVLVLDAAQLRKGAASYPVRSLLLAPLRAGERLLGLLSVDYGSAEHHFTADEMALTGTVAKLAVLVLERERLQGERAAAQARELALRETNRRMSEFLSIVSHELRAPLTGALGNIQLAERRVERLATGEEVAGMAEGATEALTLLARARRQIHRQNRLIDDLLDVSRIETNTLELRAAPCDLAAIVREAVEEQRLAVPGRTIRLEMPAESVPVVADADRIAQVVTNFLANALKYAPADQPVEVGLQRAGPVARFWVRDHGPGLSAADQARVWERFYRAHAAAPQSDLGAGLGLGLHISKTIVERHGGHVGVDSAPGAGSTFWFTLPLR